MTNAANVLDKLLEKFEVDIGSTSVSIVGADPVLKTPFLIGTATTASIAATGVMANKIWELRGGSTQKIEVDMHRVAFALRGEHHYMRNGVKAPDVWHQVSGFFQTADNRWVQLHCNMPHLRAGILRLLGAAEDYKSVSRAVRSWSAFDLEQAAVDKNLCIAAVRSNDEWKTHSHGRAVSALPLLEIIKIGDSDPEHLPPAERPLSGVRALDLTHVIAGPVCGRTLAEHGAEVMRISTPQLYHHEPFVIETGHGKLSTLLNLKTPSERQNFFNLVRDADLVIQGFRPDALSCMGLAPKELAAIRPGLIYVTLSAFGHTGPWCKRRGFDSLLQSTTGIAHEGQQDRVPKHLPAQALDYTSGYLAAFGAMVALERRAQKGGSYLVRVSLVQTGHWIQSLGRSDANALALMETKTIDDIDPWMQETETAFGLVKHVVPVLRMSGTAPYWSRPTAPYGTHSPSWLKNSERFK